MNIEAYIASGIIEDYVLGTASEQEKQEVACMSHIYPEIKEEVLRMEEAMEAYALKHQKAPSKQLKANIFAKMDFDNGPGTEESTDAKIIPLDKGNTPIEHNVEKDAQVASTRPKWTKMAVAAGLVLALLAGWAAYQLKALNGANSDMAERMERMEVELAYNSALADLYRDPSYKMVRLVGLEKSPESSVSAFWNDSSQEVVLDVQKLPAVPAGKQYQLWSIVDGVPVDMGVLDSDFDKKILKVKKTKPGTSAFAITLEQEGGSPTPTMEEMYVMGNV
ncbi:anti-sigma-K factor rskA [Dyadobacter jejuensis]|uniref:Anti-sigma-K factor rskA n=1 Tax=Dyadobacter jejuensis TaxID=1082580 RepID=A0A316AQX3_9BACT|nr:anti-sigma factor [Dyadobacter jejuensis]PWJ59614.1 anti-sigma-K factor rskA [Dyadobacter jejuensis]